MICYDLMYVVYQTQEFLTKPITNAVIKSIVLRQFVTKYNSTISLGHATPLILSPFSPIWGHQPSIDPKDLKKCLCNECMYMFYFP